MRGWMRIGMVAILAVGLVAVAGVLLSPDARRPGAPVDTVPAGVNGGSASTVEETAAAIDAARTRLARLPSDWTTWTALGLSHLERARITGDPAGYPQAEEALRRSLSIRPDGNAPALAGLGALAAARHDFTAALGHAQAAVAADPFHAGGHAVLCDALTELGRYDEAAVAAQRMVDLRPGTASYARASYQLELRGATGPAQEAMALALAAAPGSGDAAFAQQHLGQLAFDRGDLAAASSYVEDGLRQVPGHPSLHALRGRIAAARGDLPGAEAELSTVVARLPLPEYAALLGDVRSVSGGAQAAAVAYGLVQAHAELQRQAGVAVDLDLIGYLADRAVLDRVPLPPASLEAARTAHASRAQSIAAADAYGWALHAAGRSAEALSYLDSALRLGTKSAVYHYHRGAVAMAVGDRAGAAADLTEALTINPYFSLRHAVVARTLLVNLTGD